VHGKPAHGRVRTPRVHESSKPTSCGPYRHPRDVWAPSKRHGGQVSLRGEPATVEGKTLKAEAQGRYRHETRPERLRAEQSVEGPRKAEGAAQPGQASLAQVASRF
jgi:hypothetical protein